MCIRDRAKGFDQRIVTEFQHFTLGCSVHPNPRAQLLEVSKRLSHLRESLRRCATTMKEYGGMLMVRDTHVDIPQAASTMLGLGIHVVDDSRKLINPADTHVDSKSLSMKIQAENDDALTSRGTPASTGGKRIRLCGTLPTGKRDKATLPDMFPGDGTLEQGEPGDPDDADGFASSPEWKIPERGGDPSAPNATTVPSATTVPRAPNAWNVTKGLTNVTKGLTNPSVAGVADILKAALIWIICLLDAKDVSKRLTQATYRTDHDKDPDPYYRMVLQVVAPATAPGLLTPKSKHEDRGLSQAYQQQAWTHQSLF